MGGGGEATVYCRPYHVRKNTESDNSKEEECKCNHHLKPSFQLTIGVMYQIYRFFKSLFVILRKLLGKNLIMKKFVVIYRVPLDVMEKWRKETSPEEMQKQGKELGEKMAAWLAKNKAAIVDQGLPLGKNTRMTAEKLEAVSNDLNAYITVQADSAEKVSEMFKDNPHWIVPGAFLDIMEVPEWHIGQ